MMGRSQRSDRRRQALSAKRGRQMGELDDQSRRLAVSKPGIRLDEPSPPQPAGKLARWGVLVVAIILVCVVVILADFVFGAISGQGM
jgi:hypothetical protein